MAEIVQQHAADITAKRAVAAIGDLPGPEGVLWAAPSLQSLSEPNFTDPCWP
jgi:hypothetical protein